MRKLFEKQISFLQEIITDLFKVWSNEMRQTLRDAGVVIFFIVVPLAYPLIYAYIYNNEAVHEVPIVVVDQSGSSLSRDFIRRFDASHEVRVIAQAQDLNEARERINRKEGYGILLLPENFSKEIAAGRQAHVSLYSDLSSLLFYKSMLITATEVSLEMGKKIEIRNLSHSSIVQDERTAEPITSTHINIFNPQSGFASFLVVAIVILIIQQTLLLGVGMLEGTSRYMGTFTPVRMINGHHYGGTFRLVVGKSFAYFMIYTLTTLWLVIGIPRLFNLPQVGDSLQIMHFMFPYILACIFFAMTLSKLVRDREATFILFVFTSVPLLFISGISWPQSAIPAVWRYIAYIFPSTSGIQGYVKLNSMGATLWEVRSEFYLLWGLALIYLITACLVYHIDAKKRKKKLRENDR